MLLNLLKCSRTRLEFKERKENAMEEMQLECSRTRLEFKAVARKNAIKKLEECSRTRLEFKAFLHGFSCLTHL